MRLFALDPIGVAALSVKQLFRQLPMWLQINFWGLLLSLPIITLPAASAGLYFAVDAGLHDRIDGSFTPRRAFWQGFRQHFVRSIGIAIVNLVIGGVIVYSLFFWATITVPVLNYLAVVSVYFLLFWLVCQPFLYPVMIAYPDESIFETLKHTALVVIRTPLYAFLMALLVFGINLVGLLLLGPVLLILGVFLALNTTQAFWIMTDQVLPALEEKVD